MYPQVKESKNLTGIFRRRCISRYFMSFLNHKHCRQWVTFKKTLQGLNFETNLIDPCLLTRTNDKGVVILWIYKTVQNKRLNIICAFEIFELCTFLYNWSNKLCNDVLILILRILDLILW